MTMNCMTKPIQISHIGAIYDPITTFARETVDGGLAIDKYGSLELLEDGFLYSIDNQE